MFVFRLWLCMTTAVAQDGQEVSIGNNDQEVLIGNVVGVPLSGGAVLVKAVRTSPARSEEWCRTNVSTFHLKYQNDGELEGRQSQPNLLNWGRWNGPHEDTVHKFQLLDQEFSLRIVTAAEAIGSRRGWTTRRHHVYATCDLPVSKIPQVSTEVFQLLDDSLLPAVVGMYNLNGAGLSIRDVFVVKYDAVTEGAQTGLEMHEDGSAYSFNTLLSLQGDFVGGGTRFEELGVSAESRSDSNPLTSPSSTVPSATRSDSGTYDVSGDTTTEDKAMKPLGTKLTSADLARAGEHLASEADPQIPVRGVVVSPKQGETLVHRGQWHLTLFLCHIQQHNALALQGRKVTALVFCFPS
jgi:hypothetical protein